MKYAAGPLIYILLLGSALAGCGGRVEHNSFAQQAAASPITLQEKQPARKNPGRVVYVLVALCDNVNQGIVPVSATLGNGEDTERNLYWGAAFGVKSFFVKSREWRLVADVRDPKYAVLERVVFKHRTQNVYLVADAYRGAEIKRAIGDFLSAAAGGHQESLETNIDSQKVSLNIGGGADLIGFVGHDGLMDFHLAEYPQKMNDAHREVMILSCASKQYFAVPLRRTGAHPLLWTTNLMAPEAYILKTAIDGWMLGEDGEKIRLRAATAYNSYQKCGAQSARNLFANGW